MTLVWKTEGHFTASEKLILLYIADRGNFEGKHSYPSLSTLASRCDLGLATVHRCIRNLEKKKILSRSNRYLANRMTSNTYSINLNLLTHFVDNPVDKPCITLVEDD